MNKRIRKMRNMAVESYRLFLAWGDIFQWFQKEYKPDNKAYNETYDTIQESMGACIERYYAIRDCLHVLGVDLYKLKMPVKSKKKHREQLQRFCNNMMKRGSG